MHLLKMEKKRSVNLLNPLRGRGNCLQHKISPPTLSRERSLHLSSVLRMQLVYRNFPRFGDKKR